jgi:hypothetical protein
LAEADPAGGAGGLGGGESLERDAFRIDGGEANAGLGAAAIEDGGGVAWAEPEDMDGVMGLLGGEVAGGGIGKIKTVAGHGSTLEQLAGLFEERVPLGVGGVITQTGKVFESLLLGVG